MFKHQTIQNVQDFSQVLEWSLPWPHPRPRLKPFLQGQGQSQDLHYQSQGQGQDLTTRGQGQDLQIMVSSRIFEAKARPRGQQDWQYVKGQMDNKLGTDFGHICEKSTSIQSPSSVDDHRWIVALNWYVVCLHYVRTSSYVKYES